MKTGNQFIEKIIDDKDKYKKYILEYDNVFFMNRKNRERYEKDLELYNETFWLIRLFKGIKKPNKDDKKYEEKPLPESPLEEYMDKLRHTSPDLNMLYDIADFIKFADQIWMIPNVNTKKNTIYSSYKYEKNQNGFIIRKSEGDKEYDIVVKIYTSYKRVAIEVKNRISGGTFDYYFTDNEWEIDDPTSAEFLSVEFIENIIMNTFCNVFEECYKLSNNRDTLL